MIENPVRVAVLASGEGTLLEALIRREHHYNVALVVTNRECGAESVAERHAKPHLRIRFAGRNKQRFTDRLIATLQKHNVEAIALAGFRRMVPRTVIDHVHGRAYNCHPALLPFFGGKDMYGLNVHRAVIASGMLVTGCTIHHVNEQYDEGGIIVQDAITFNPNESVMDVAEKVHDIERALYAAFLNVRAKALRDPERNLTRRIELTMRYQRHGDRLYEAYFHALDRS